MLPEVIIAKKTNELRIIYAIDPVTSRGSNTDRSLGLLDSSSYRFICLPIGYVLWDVLIFCRLSIVGVLFGLLIQTLCRINNKKSKKK
jgi:hypothetical protein